MPAPSRTSKGTYTTPKTLALPATLTVATPWMAVRGDNASAGWLIATTQSNERLVFRVRDGLGVQEAAPAYDIAPADVGDIMGAVFVHTGTRLRAYVDRVQIGGNGPLIAGYTPYAGPTCIGCLPSTFNVRPYTPQVFGVGGGNGVPTLANIQAWFDACKADIDFADMPGVPMSRRWILSVQGTINDETGSGDDIELVNAPPIEYSGPTAWRW
jgi:hypothetical protein